MFIKSFTDVTYKIKATALKGASIVEYKAICANQTKTTASGTLEDVGSGYIQYQVKDSRGNIATASFTAELVSYKNLTCNLSVDVPTADGATTVRIDGNYSGVTFGSASGASTNDLIVYYKYVDSDGTDSGWLDISDSVTISNNTYSVDLEVTGLDYTKKYNFYAKAVDKISSVTTDAYPVKTMPVFDWGENDFNFNVPVTITEDGTSFNLLGMAKAMSNSYVLTTTATASTNYSSVSGTATLVGNTLRVYFKVTRSSAPAIGNITDEEMCTLTVTHNGKIKSAYNVGFINGGGGGVASFHTSTDTSSNNLSIKLTLAATTVASTTFSGYFAIPVLINLDKY